MMKFYLNNQEVEVRVCPQLQETKDESLDNFSVVLKANTTMTPYAPLQPFKIVTDTKTHNFVVASDKVSRMANDSELYVHELQLTQNIKVTDTQLIRNNVFSQPRDNKVRGYMAISNAKIYENGYYNYRIMNALSEYGQIWIENIVLPKKAKFKNPKMRITRYDVGTDKIISKRTGNFDSIESIYFKGENWVGDYDIILNDDDPLNKWIPIPDDSIEVGVKRSFLEFLELNDNKGTITIRDYGRYEEEHIFLGASYEADENSPLVATLQVEFEIEYYYYSAYDIISELLKQKNKKGNETPLFTLPQEGELYDLLVSTVPPTMTFTQCTLFDALREIFMLFDAIFTIDENGVLGIEYYNERNENDVSDTAISGFGSTHSESNYRNGMVNYYQNAIIETKFPAKNYAGLRNNNVGVGTENIHFLTPYPIEYLQNIFLLVKNDNGGAIGRLPAFDPSVGSIPIYGQVELDMTPFCFEQSVYAVLDITNDYPVNRYFTNKSQSGSFFYIKGADYVDISTSIYKDYFGRSINTVQNALNAAWHRFFGFCDNSTDSSPNDIDPPHYDNDWGKYKFRVEYLANVSGRAKIESFENKYSGDMISNQSNGRIDINKTGLNMIGLSLKLGQPTLSYTHKIGKFDTRIKKGDYIVRDGEIWVANVCTYTLFNDDLVQGNIEFTKNFNALESNIRVDHEKRLTNISNELALKCEDDLVDYIYFSQEYPDNNIRTKISLECSTWAEGVVETLFPTGELQTFNGAMVVPKYEDGSSITFSEKNLPVSNIYIPLLKYGFGNALCFEVSFNSPISAGKQTTISENWYADKYYTIEYLYTDDEGWFDLIDIVFIEMADEISQKFPYIEESEYAWNSAIRDFPYYKKPNEIFALNYELVCLPMPNRVNVDFIGSAFINDNALVKDRKLGKTYLHYETDDSFKYSMLDRYGNKTNVKEVTLEYTAGAGATYHIRIVINTGLTEKPHAWALCNEDGEILVASNECLSFTNDGLLTIYFHSNSKRL